jgi:hypothetical protein
VWFCLENAEGTDLALPSTAYVPPLTARTIEEETDLHFHVPDTTPDQMASDPMPILRPAMDYLWQAYGWPRCPYFADDGSLASE